MNITLDLHGATQLRAFAVFLNTVADDQAKQVQSKLDAYGLGGINRDANPVWRNEGGQIEPLVLDEKAFLGETTGGPVDGTPTRKHGEPSPGHKRRTKAEIAEDEAYEAQLAARVADDTQHAEIMAAGRAAISTGGERVGPDDEPEVEQQDAADEASETAQAGAELSHDDVRGAMGKYVEKFGMDAAQIDLPKLFGLALKNPAITKVSMIPGDQKSLKTVVDGVNEMLAKNPFDRTPVA